MKLISGIAALIVLGAGVPAVAADLGARPYGQAPAYAAPIYQWTGFYLGGHLGGAFSGSSNFNGLVLSNYDARLLGGIQAGADYQFGGSFVVGVEGQYSWLGSNKIGAIFPAGFVYRTTSAGSARSPAGSATPGVRRCSTPRAAMPIPAIAKP